MMLFLFSWWPTDEILSFVTQKCQAVMCQRLHSLAMHACAAMPQWGWAGESCGKEDGKRLHIFTRSTCCRWGELSFQRETNHLWKVQRRFKFLDCHFLHVVSMQAKGRSMTSLLPRVQRVSCFCCVVAKEREVPSKFLTKYKFHGEPQMVDFLWAVGTLHYKMQIWRYISTSSIP